MLNGSRLNNGKLSSAKLVHWLVLILLMGKIGFASADTKATDKPQVAILLTTSEPMPQRQLLGQVSAPRSQVLSTQVQGLVISKRMEMGQLVQVGDVLVQLDAREAQAMVELKQADLAIATSRLAQQQLVFARAQKTYSQKATSQSEFEQVELELALSKSQVDVAQSNLTLARLALEKYRIVAPFSGSLLEPTPVMGLYAKVGERLTELQNNDQLRVDVQLSPQEVQQFKQQQIWLNFNLNQKPEQTSNQAQNQVLTLLAVSPKANQTTGMMEATFQLPSVMAMGQGIQPGQKVNLTLYSDRLNIPPKSIHNDKEGSFLFTVAQGKVDRVAIDRVQQGQSIIVLGFNGMKVGDAVSTISVDVNL